MSGEGVTRAEREARSKTYRDTWSVSQLTHTLPVGQSEAGMGGPSGATPADGRTGESAPDRPDGATP